MAMSLTLVGHVDLADGDDTRAQALLAEAASLFADTGNLMFLPWCLEGLAAVATARGDNERAAELDGAREALRAQIGVLLPPDPTAYARTLATARAGLTPAAFDAARARTARLAPQQIISQPRATGTRRRRSQPDSDEPWADDPRTRPPGQRVLSPRSQPVRATHGRGPTQPASRPWAGWSQFWFHSPESAGVRHGPPEC